MTNLGGSRRDFLKTLTTTTLVTGTSLTAFAKIVDKDKDDGYSKAILTGYNPSSPHFHPIKFMGNADFSKFISPMVSEAMAEAVKEAPKGRFVAWGIPFDIPDKVIFIKSEAFQLNIEPSSGNFIVFMHTSDQEEQKIRPDGFYEKPFRGMGRLNEVAANYVVGYEDGSEVVLPIRKRGQIGWFQRKWGENCVESVPHLKSRTLSFLDEKPNGVWGGYQTRVSSEDGKNWMNWLWAWENPNPGKKITGFRFEPSTQAPLIISAISIGNVVSNPLRWEQRQKAIFSLPKGSVFDPYRVETEMMAKIQLDLGQVISVTPRLVYPDMDWPESYNNKAPKILGYEIIVEYTAHPDAQFHINNEELIPVSGLINNKSNGLLKLIKPAHQKVAVHVNEKGSTKPVPVKFHAHGESGEYLAPVDRHRQPNTNWFEDYSVDYVSGNLHNCTYITGETLINLPYGRVYIEISKGFEIKPVRKVIEVTPETETLSIYIEKVLNWREKGWVTADTHVHFLSPVTAMLEGSAEGINIVNLLASQWGELMTNVGDFDGKSVFGSKSAGGDGEYIVRVGTENRQHLLGHISLLGYNGNIIAPMTTGGPDESALGDPIEILLTEWAMQCKKQDGIVILPHFPDPRLENAAAIVSGGVDGVEMTSWGFLYGGIDPYSLTDWYRYLNCGYFVAAVGGTDKMGADTAVGTVRTYAKIPENHEFTYDEWKESIRRGETFVTFGPLIEFSVEGKPAGSRIEMSSNGGTVNVTWEVASVTIPMTRVDLIVNGEVKESVTVSDWKGNGNWSFKVSGSSWIALLVRGHYPDRPEIIAAHTSPVMIQLKDSPMLAAADALTILEQIEGAMAYLDTIGTRAEDKAYKRMKMVLTSAHRTLHNRMHEAGQFHQHTPVNYHPEHG